MMTVSLPGRIRTIYKFCCVVLTILLTGCTVALISLVLHWNSFTTEDGTVIRFPVEGLENLKVNRTYSLLWSCVLVMPLCFTAMFLICFNRRFMIVLMILTGLIGFASSVYASKNFKEIYDKIHIIFEDDDDAFDERCDSKSYNDVHYCVCNVGSLKPSKNQTQIILKFRVDECDEMEDVTGNFYLFFILSMTTSLLSGVLLVLSFMEWCIPLKQTSAVLLQNETFGYDSTKQDQPPTTNRIQTEGFNNPVFIQCNKSGEKKQVFWYPYPAAPNVSINDDPLPTTVRSGTPSEHVTFSNFTKGRHEKPSGPVFG